MVIFMTAARELEQHLYITPHLTRYTLHSLLSGRAISMMNSAFYFYGRDMDMFGCKRGGR